MASLKYFEKNSAFMKQILIVPVIWKYRAQIMLFTVHYLNRLALRCRTLCDISDLLFWVIFYCARIKRSKLMKAQYNQIKSLFKDHFQKFFLWRFARFDSICRIWKVWKRPTEECSFQCTLTCKELARILISLLNHMIEKQVTSIMVCFHFVSSDLLSK